MSAFGSYLLGLIVAHVAWLYFFTTGHLLRRRLPDDLQPIGIDTLVITTVAGMALSGFGLLFLGFAHLLNGFGLVSFLLLEAACFWLLKRDNCLSFAFWKEMVRHFLKAWTLAAFFIYLLFLALGLPAILPPIDSDPVSYHLAYAADWANAGRIYVDPFLRFPYYANNFLLFDSALFILKLGNYSHFLTWLCGLLTCLGVLAFFTPAELRPIGGLHPASHFHPQQFLIPISVGLSPVFLRYLNVGYMDVPIGLFILVPILCVYRTSSERLFARELAVIAAFCVGMKLTLIGHLPFFLVSLLLASAHRLRTREIALLIVALVVLSLPWYIRNLIEAHDPTPPIFNLYFKHPDPIHTQADAEIYSSHTQSDLKKPLSLVLLPFQFFIDPERSPFLEFGVSAMVLLVLAPLLFLLVLFCYRKRCRAPDNFLYLSVAVAYLASPWFYNANGRHALHWCPALAAWVGVGITLLYMRADRLWDSRLAMGMTRTATAIFCCALIVPSPTRKSVQFYRDYYARTLNFVRLRGNRERYLAKNLTGYLAGRAVMETLMSENREKTHVLALGVNLHFYFRKNARIISVGDYFGPARYSDLFAEVREARGCPSYLDRLDISTVITWSPRKETWWPDFYAKFRPLLRNCGYAEYRCGEERVAIFLKSDIKPNWRLHPVP
jgi:hypothetical protein